MSNEGELAQLTAIRGHLEAIHCAILNARRDRPFNKEPNPDEDDQDLLIDERFDRIERDIESISSAVQSLSSDLRDITDTIQDESILTRNRIGMISDKLGCLTLLVAVGVAFFLYRFWPTAGISLV